MTIENLDQVRAKLYEIFNEAVNNHARYEDESAPYRRANPKIQNRIAIGDLAQAIAMVEHEQREAQKPQMKLLPKGN